jgi:Protein of unknown function (DUF1036)
VNRLRSLLLTALILLPASRLPGQPVRAIDQDGGVYNTPVVCNDGTLVFSVARAFRDISEIHGDQWTTQGWYSVRPGQCNEIPPEQLYLNGGWFGADSVTLLAFAFTDSTGVWGAARVRDNTDGVFKTSNQQLCVLRDAFRGVHRDSEGGPAGDCAKGRPGLFLIPASLEFRGDSYGGFYGREAVNKGRRDNLRVKLSSNDRAIPLGPQSSSSTPGNTSSNAGPKPAADDGNSFGTMLLDEFRKEMRQSAADAANRPLPPAELAKQQAQAHAAMLGWVREDVASYIEASRTGFNAYKKGAPQSSQGLRMWESNTKPLFAKNCFVVQGETATTLSCLLSEKNDLNALRADYAELTEDVTASLPAGWAPVSAPPYGPDFPASKGYRASSGAHGEIWIARAASGEYQLHYQLVSPGLAAAPAANPTPPAAAPKDPIGSGGFITPPTVRR